MAVKFDPILDKLREKDTDADSIDIGDAVTGGTAGSVLFVGAAATLAQDNANLFFNDTTNRLGVGVTDPDSKVEVLATTTQQKWSYDADSFATITVAESSHTTITTGETGNLIFADSTGTLANVKTLRQESFVLACSDETTALTTGTAKVTFRMPYAFTLKTVRASLTTAGTGVNLVTVDINEGGATILTTKITIDATETTSTTAAAQPVIGGAGPALADDAQMTIDIDQIDSGGVSAGLKVYLIGYQTV